MIGDKMNTNEIIYAKLKGNKEYPRIKGNAYFYPFKKGTIVEVEVMNLPLDDSHPYAFHIHEGTSCGKEFELTKGHYNPENKLHPMHAGDLPPLFSNQGYSYMKVYTDRFTPSEVVGRTIVIHHDRDDFKTHPSGNSGVKIACGVIKKSRIVK